MKLKVLLIMGVIGGLCACSERKGYFSPNEIPRLTSECEMLSEKEIERISNSETPPDSDIFVRDTLPDGTIKGYCTLFPKAEILRTYDRLAQYPYFIIYKVFDRLTGKLLSKEIEAHGSITIGMSFHFYETGRVKEIKQEEKGYKINVNQLLKLLSDRGIFIPKTDDNYVHPDTTCIGILGGIYRIKINGNPCYSAFYHLPKDIGSVYGKTLEIDGADGTILGEKDESYNSCE